MTPGRSISLTLLVLGSLTVACSPPATPPGAGEEATALVPIPKARIPIDGVLSGGQPNPEQIETAAQAGYATVINLRTDEEGGFEWEAAAVENLGMRYIHIPVAGAAGLTRENIERIDAALNEAREVGPVILHCASGNRVGAALALRAAWIQGVPPEEAMELGLAGGLTRLQGPTRELLGLPEQP